MHDILPSLTIMWVGIGGGIGAVLRYRIGKWVSLHCRGSTALATFFVNITGAFMLAYLSVALNIEWQVRYITVADSLILTGILGGYTSFSSMQLDALKLCEAGRRLQGAFYLVATVLSGIIGTLLGHALAGI